MFGDEVAEQVMHRVVFTKEGHDWVVVATDLHGAHSWGPTLKSATEHIKEAIALVLDLADGAEATMLLDPSYQVEGIDDDGDPDVFRRALDARTELKTAQAEAEDALRRAVAEGRKHRVSMRDIATMTGVSYQRVAQIADGDRARSR